MSKFMVSLEDQKRFWKKVNFFGENGCWEWIACVDTNGFGMIFIDGGPRAAHRISWEVFNGEIPKGYSYHGLCVCHKCDNPRCVNPDHLFLGTHTDNMKDMVKKGRSANHDGEKNGRSKLTRENVLKIRELHATGNYTYKNLASIYGVDYSTIRNIVVKVLWSNV